jgi:hypothetical protein
VVGEAVAHIAQATLLDVLLDGVERLLLGDFHLGIGPAGNLDDHVENAIVPVCKERDVMERRDDLAVLLDVNAVFCYIDYIPEGQEITCLSESGHTEGVGGADESRTVFWGKGMSLSGGRQERTYGTLWKKRGSGADERVDSRRAIPPWMMRWSGRSYW